MFSKGWGRAGGDMFTQNAKTVFMHRGVECWTKSGPAKSDFSRSHNGYFRIILPGFTGYDGVTRVIADSPQHNSLPNGGFTYFVRTAVKDEVVLGFDGMHGHNLTNPLSNEAAMLQIRNAIDFLLDNGYASVPAETMQA